MKTGPLRDTPDRGGRKDQLGHQSRPRQDVLASRCEERL